MVENIKHRVAVIHNTVAPYRHPLFEKLSEDSSLDLTIYYCSRGHQGRKWESYPRKYRYKRNFLPGITFKYISINPTVIHEIVKGRWNVVIISGWVDITMQMAFIAGNLLNIPLIFWIENIEEPRSFLGLITRPIRMLFIRKADAIIVPGRLSKNYVISIGADKSKVFIAPNCIDNDFFIEHNSKYKKNKERLKKELKVNKQKVILYVGQLIQRKAVDHLIRAYGRLKKEHKEVALIIVGSGSLRNQLKYMCNVKRISDVHFIESGLKLVDLIKYYSIADVFVLATLFDVWGFVINEAMACGLPVISTKNAQAAIEMIRQGENGFVVNEADEEELYSAMKKLLSSSELELMGRKSLEIVATKFDPSLMKKRFIEAISCALSV